MRKGDVLAMSYSNEENKKISKNVKNKSKEQQSELKEKDSGYLLRMSHAPKIGEGESIGQLIPLVFFTVAVMIIVRLVIFSRPMDEFFWWPGAGEHMLDFFSYGKMVAILICGALVALMLLYRVFTQSLAIKKSFIYIPMLVYTLFVILSHIFSDYREFARLGANERFEGTFVLIVYMLVLFYAINTINSKRDVKIIIFAVAGISIPLGLIGVSQFTGNDFFQTQLGGMMISPRGFWGQLGELRFLFDGQIYQTVYNPNYVSFYLTLLIPIFGFLLVHSIMKGDKLRTKIIWGIVLALALINLVGSASIGGALGLGITTIAAFALFGKRLVTVWRKPLIILLAIAIPIMIGLGHYEWFPKIFDTVASTVNVPTQTQEQTADVQTTGGEATSRGARSYIDFMTVEPEEDTVRISVDGNEMLFWLHFDIWPNLTMFDADGNPLHMAPWEEGDFLRINDERFEAISFLLTEDSFGEPAFIIVTDDIQAWRFVQTWEGLSFINDLGHTLELRRAEGIGFANNLNFGSGRGYIWSRTFPMMRDTLFIGHGADTFTVFFPHYDYIGRYNLGWNVNLIIDKPHNMYMHMAVGTGGVSMLAFLILLGFYFVQSAKIYRRRKIEEFHEFAGLGIFLGVIGFSTAAMVNDSSVSVMPLFYGLLGTGIAINIMLKREQGEEKQ